MSGPTQTCQLCGRCPCSPTYRAGLRIGGPITGQANPARQPAERVQGEAGEGAE